MKVMGDLNLKYQLLKHPTALAKKHVTEKIYCFYDWVSEICSNTD